MQVPGLTHTYLYIIYMCVYDDYQVLYMHTRYSIVQTQSITATHVIESVCMTKDGMMTSSSKHTIQ